MMLPSLPGIGSDVVLTPGNFQAYPELCLIFIPKHQVVVYEGVNIKNPGN